MQTAGVVIDRQTRTMFAVMILRCIFLLIFAICVKARLQIFISSKPLQQIGENYYLKEVLTSEYEAPKELAYDSSSRNLYFMYMDDRIQNSGRALINVRTKESLKINGIERNKATAVDQETGDVYFGSDDGLYKYDPITNRARKIALFNFNISKIVIMNNAMYVLNANDHSMYKIFDDGKVAVKIGDWTNVYNFNVDYTRNIHFVNADGVFCLIGGHEIVKNEDLNVVYAFLINENKTLGISDNGVYDIDCENGKAKKLSDLLFIPTSIVYGDYGEIFYTAGYNIYHLKPVRSYLIYNVDSPDFDNISLNRNNTRIVKVPY